MKLHPTVIKKLIQVFETYGGHRENVRLHERLAALEVEAYTQTTRSPPDTFIVLKEDIESHKKKNE